MTMRTKRLVLDTETTGLKPGIDEILTLSIVDGAGEIVWDALYKPEHTAEWPEAEAVNGISPADVEGCKGIAEDVEAVNAILADCEELVIYNARYDLGMLAAVGIAPGVSVKVTDTMLEFAESYGQPSKSHRAEYRWQKLSFAAHHVGYEWGCDHAHSSVGDCRATLAVQRALDSGEVETWREELDRVRAERDDLDITWACPECGARTWTDDADLLGTSWTEVCTTCGCRYDVEL